MTNTSSVCVDFSRSEIWGKLGTGALGICLKGCAKFPTNRTMCSRDAIRPQPLMDKKRFKHKTLAVEYGDDNDVAEVLLNLQCRLHNCIMHIAYCIPRSTIHNVFISSRRGLGLCGEFEQLCCHWRSGRRLPRRPYWGFGWDRTNFQTASNSELSYQDKPNNSFHNMAL